MKRTRNLIGRSLSGFGAGIVVFIGMILTLPVPSTLLSPTEDVPQGSFAVIDVTVLSSNPHLRHLNMGYVVQNASAYPNTTF